ncbi:MAG: 50S ribosomal protein L24 [Syntrophorhabdales bacterium]|jgi:large subunit ribosomal protein L24
MEKTYHIRKNDNVMVMAGKDKGKTGKVLRINRKTDRIIVEKVNMIKRHVRPSQKTKGGIMERESAIHVSNVMIYCEKCSKPVKAGTRVLEDGKKARYCKKCNEVLDK